MGLLDEIRAKQGYSPNNSVNWFINNVHNLSQTGFKPMNFLGENASKQVTRFSINEIGKMVQFFYSPKHKDTLPVYDTFPLVLPFNFVNGRIYGLNIHYMHPKFRLVLFDKLSSIIGDENQRSSISWQILKRFANLPQMTNCVKSYIPKHIKSNIIVFGKEDYVPAIFLPSHQFKKQSANEVWS